MITNKYYLAHITVTQKQLEDFVKSDAKDKCLVCMKVVEPIDKPKGVNCPIENCTACEPKEEERDAG